MFKSVARMDWCECKRPFHSKALCIFWTCVYPSSSFFDPWISNKFLITNLKVNQFSICLLGIAPSSNAVPMLIVCSARCPILIILTSLDTACEMALCRLIPTGFSPCKIWLLDSKWSQSQSTNSEIV